ncbi:transglutaminase-like domain-containing protein [Rubellimicrobium aerolatum]|uniref:Transglutaminase family protein n=1 Tax=Rubellimicrobium aerolatum TaxID=490979 RepID=A0ABW0SG02_9RHOB|nr:transglutaminase family protein [Rubellimicrobium aerolatum]MBP1806416.1 transglutaminase-like putative cysteine protease [Rubellimicrobium aerolatum]
MLIRAAFDITLSSPAPTPLILALSPHPTELPRLSADALVVDPAVPVRWFHDTFGNFRGRLVMPAGRLRLTWSGLATDEGRPDDMDPGAVQHPVENLPDEVLPFLLPSRYCESDLLSQEAWDRFGAVPAGWARVQAICDHVHESLIFDYGDASPFRTARSSIEEGKAVCRDFAHLVIAYARALNIPARYASGYLGDIDWPDMGPGDFCAWTEIFLGGRWYTFDARYNAPRIGRIVMVRGRDAADVPMITSFGPTNLDSFEVWCDEVPARAVA